MDNGAEEKDQNHVLFKTVKSLKITGTRFLNQNTKTNTMTKQKIVLAEFEYYDPTTGKPYFYQTGWPCKDNYDAELTVKYYGMKTGAINAKIKIEDLNNEETK